MPLPVPQSQWPPQPYGQAHAAIAEVNDWWIGTPSRLTARYAGTPQGSVGSWTTGLKDKLGWGRSPARAQAPTRRVHVPIAADLANTSGTLLLSDPWSVRCDGDANDKANERADLIFNTSRQHSAMLEAAESCAALGGTFVRVVWNVALADHVWLDYVDADQAIPFFSYGRLQSVLFWRVLVDDNDMVLRHFEWHTKGGIHHALYLGSRINVGRPVPLTEHDETATIPVNSDGIVPTNVPLLTAGYIPNSRPNPEWRGIPALRHLGRSDFGDPGVISLMDQVDEAYSSLARDIRLAKARLIIDQGLTQTGRPGQGSAFDVDQEAYTTVRGAGPDQAPILELKQADIRVDPILKAAEAYTREILRRVGYSPATFGMSDDVALTATEVDAQVRRSVQTHKVKSGHMIGGHSEPSEAALLIDAQVFRTGAMLGDGIQIDWAPPVRESRLQSAQTIQALDTARAVSLETKVAMLWPDRDEAWREEEVDRLRKEQALADPLALGAGFDGATTSPAVPVADPEADTPEQGGGSSLRLRTPTR
ncbi:phage portal protein [Rhodococcus ruber]|uniref:phage portal protein n=1 Tax=Rhodococcus ruber TaxID=1830 RepID=UPI003782EC1F